MIALLLKTEVIGGAEAWFRMDGPTGTRVTAKCTCTRKLQKKLGWHHNFMRCLHTGLKHIEINRGQETK